jgi:hypothetical protein
MGEPSNLDKNDVLSVDTKEYGWVVLQDQTFKAGDLITALNHYLPGAGRATEMLLGKGLACEVLKPGFNWRKGKVKLSLEFCPDEPKSPLDDLRQRLQASEG